MVLLEPVERGGVVKQDIGVQNIVFCDLRWRGESEVRRFRVHAGCALSAAATSGFRVFFKQCGLSFLGMMDHRVFGLGFRRVPGSRTPARRRYAHCQFVISNLGFVLSRYHDYLHFSFDDNLEIG